MLNIVAASLSCLPRASITHVSVNTVFPENHERHGACLTFHFTPGIRGCPGFDLRWIRLRLDCGPA
jgi:hypothetical protein